MAGLSSRRLFLGLAAVLLALAPPLNYGSDGAAMFDVAQSFVTEGDIDVACSPNTIERADGRCFSTFYLLQSVALVPFVAVGRLLGGVVGAPASFAAEAVAMILPALVTAAAATLVALLARERGAGPRAAVLAALAYVVGTEALTITRTLFAEPLGAACLVLCAWGLLAPPGAGRPRLAVGLIAAALAVMTKPHLLLAAPCAGAALGLRDRRWRPALLAIAGTAVGSLVVLAYNWHRFGSALDFGGAKRKLYIGGSPDGEAPVVELVDGAARLLVSPNHGLLFFAPVALLGLASLLRRPIDRIAAACVGGAVGVFAFAMIQPDGNFWGTRYLVPLLPLACVGVAGLGRRGMRLGIALMLIVAVSQAPNLVSYPERLKDPEPTQGGFRWLWPDAWDINRLALVNAWPEAADQIRAARDTEPASLVDAAPEGRSLRVVALWWWMLPAIGIPAVLGAGLSLVVLAGGVLLVLRAAREPPAPAT